jgi:1-acyl-sn-glycerol-3-phosphate acyltransferase
VAIVGPHTSNWDLVLLLAMACAFGVRISWMGKEAIFRAPFGAIMRWLGGIPVRRDTSRNLVAQMVDRFAASDRLVLAVPAEGTRSGADHWRSGFYHIARGANVPIATSFVDYSRKVGGFGPMVTVTDDVVSDMDRIRGIYDGVVGKRPHLQGPARLREETEAAPPSDPADQ